MNEAVFGWLYLAGAVVVGNVLAAVAVAKKESPFWVGFIFFIGAAVWWLFAFFGFVWAVGRSLTFLFGWAEQCSDTHLQTPEDLARRLAGRRPPRHPD